MGLKEAVRPPVLFWFFHKDYSNVLSFHTRTARDDIELQCPVLPELRMPTPTIDLPEPIHVPASRAGQEGRAISSSVNRPSTAANLRHRRIGGRGQDDIKRVQRVDTSSLQKMISPSIPDSRE